MSADNFDPYYEWLGIPPEEQPANYYRLLGIREFETNVNAIANAADGRMMLLKSFQTGPHEKLVQQILNEISAARVCLLDERKRTEYDQRLRLQKVVNSRPAESPKPRTHVQEPAVQSMAPEIPLPPLAGLSAQEPAVQSVVPAAPEMSASWPSFSQPLVFPSSTQTGTEFTASASISAHAVPHAESHAVPHAELDRNFQPHIPEPRKSEPPVNSRVSVPEPSVRTQPPAPTPPQPPVLEQTPPIPTPTAVFTPILSSTEEDSHWAGKDAQALATDEPFSWKVFYDQQKPLVQKYLQLRTEYLEKRKDNDPASQLIQTLERNFGAICVQFYKHYEHALELRQNEQERLAAKGCRCDSPPMVAALSDCRRLRQEQALFADNTIDSYLKCLNALIWYPEAKEIWNEEKAAAAQKTKKIRDTRLLFMGLAAFMTVCALWFGTDQKVENQPTSQPVLRSAQTHKAGKRMVKTVDGVEYAFRWCPPGTFLMGSPKEEEDRNDDETQHRVTLTEGFWMLETEVTQTMWRSVMGRNPSHFKGDSLPVEMVSWDDCQEFCRKLSEKMGLKLTLPTEAQWEYACRAGTTGPYAGDSLEAMAWYDENWWRPGSTHPVGQKLPNAWGLYDMHGNVYEWCQDWYSSYPVSHVINPTGPNDSSNRVFRGGCWRHNAKDCRSAHRSFYSPYFWKFYLGFRVAASDDQGD